MQITIKTKMKVSREQDTILVSTTQEYIRLVNSIVTDMVANNNCPNLSSKDVTANLPSTIKCQAIQDARSVFGKYKKTNILPVLKKPIMQINNQNWNLKNSILQFPVWIDNKSQRMFVQIFLDDKQKRDFVSGKLGTLRISKKNRHWYVQIAIDIPEKENLNTGEMGIDLGLKVPAVAFVDNKKVKFFGNGRENKFMRRKHNSFRRKLQQLKKSHVIKKMKDKEQRWMKDKDHKISRQIVNFALANKVKVIKMESLEGIRETTRTSRKNVKNLHKWSFYRLQNFITYKARKEGIEVVLVNPRNTSKICPVCGKLNVAKDRRYKCSGCGFSKHRDLVGSMNILKATMVSGDRIPAAKSIRPVGGRANDIAVIRNDSLARNALETSF